MSKILEKKLDYWEKKLLDLSKRNRMLNFKDKGRSTLKLITPSFEELWNRVVLLEEDLTFKHPVDKGSDLRIFSIISLLEILSRSISVVRGDIDTDISLSERQKTLKNLRAKSKLSLDEQGNNILYMTVGFVEWTDELATKGNFIKAPLIMVPVSLLLKSLNTPYVLRRYDSDIVVNPTLAYYWNEKYGLELPSFDVNEQSIDEYLKSLEKIVDKRGWKITKEISLGLLSFLKINMYHDIKNNKEKLLNSTILKAIIGEESNDTKFYVQKFKHDSVLPINNYQVVNADSSQQDAIALSQQGISFVIQGPPGTGKSQTITNIIATALADGKKILFVSEKKAALQVVYKRLQEVHLDDFCLPLHSHKANKKEILERIGDALNIPICTVKDEAIAKLYLLNNEREKLNSYADGLHNLITPLEESIYNAYGVLSELSEDNNVHFSVKNIETIDKETLTMMKYYLVEYDSALKKMGCKHDENPWIDTNIDVVTNKLLEEIQDNFFSVIKIVEALINQNIFLSKYYNFNLLNNFSNIDLCKDIINAVLKAIKVPLEWLNSYNLIDVLKVEVEQKLRDKEKYIANYDDIIKRYSEDVFKIDAKELKKQIRKYYIELSNLIIPKKIVDESEIIETQSNMKKIYKKLCEIATSIDLIQKTTGYVQEVSYNNLKNYNDLILLLCKTPKINEKWFSIINFDDLINICNKTKIFWTDFSSIKDEIANKSKDYYTQNVYSLEIEKRQNEIKDYRFKISELIVPEKIINEESIKKTRYELDLIYKRLNEIIFILEFIKDKTDYNKEITYKNLCNYNDLVCLLIKTPHVNSEWFSVENFDDLIELCNRTKSLWTDFLSIKYEIANKSKDYYTQNVYSLEIEKRQNEIKDYRFKISELIVPERIINEESIKKTRYELDLIYKRLNEIIFIVEFIKDKTDYNKEITYKNLCNYNDLVCLLIKTPHVNGEWFSVENFDDLIELCNRTKNLWTDFFKLKNELNKKVDFNTLELCDISLFEKLSLNNILAEEISLKIGLKDSNFLTLELVKNYFEELNDKFCFLNKLLDSILKENNFLVNSFGFQKFNFKSDIEIQIKICEVALNPIFPLECWANIFDGDESYKLIYLAEYHNKVINKLQEEILIIYENKVFELDFNAMLKRFKIEYRNIFKWFKKSYHLDRKEIYLVCKKIKSKITDDEIINLLYNLKTISESREWLSQNNDAILLLIGDHYVGSNTDFTRVLSNIESFKKLMVLFKNSNNAVCATSIKSKESLNYVEKYFLHLTQFNKFCVQENCKIDDIFEYIKTLDIYLKNVIELKNLFEVAIKNIDNKNISYISLVDIYERLNNANCLKNNISKNEKTLEIYFPEAYKRENTNWDNIISNIECFVKIKSYYFGFQTEKIENLLLSMQANSIFVDFSNIFDEAYEIYDSINQLFLNTANENCLLSDTAFYIKNIIKKCDKLIACYDFFLEFSKIKYSWKDIDNYIIFLIDLLYKVKEYNYLKNIIIENEKIIEIYFPEAYKRENTNWDNIISDIECFIKIKSYYFGFQTEKIENLLLSMQANSIFVDFSNIFDEAYKIYDSINQLFLNPANENCLLSDTAFYIKNIIKKCDKLIACYDFFLEFSKIKCSWKDIDNYIIFLIDLLHKVEECNYLKDNIIENEKTLKVYFPEDYKGKNTNWDNIISDIECFFKIKYKYFDLSSEKLKSLLLSKNASMFFEDISNDLFNAPVIIESINQLLNIKIDNKHLVLSSIDTLKIGIETIDLLINCYSNLNSLAFSKSKWKSLDLDMDLIVYIQNVKEYYLENHENLILKYKNFFKGLETDWKVIKEQLDFAANLKKYIDDYSLSKIFVKNIFKIETTITNFNQIIILLENVAELNTKISFIDSLFDESFNMFVFSFEAINFKLLNCIKKLNLLEKQIDYRNTKRDCFKFGLESFIITIENSKEKINNIPNAFIKGFYKKWLDFALDQTQDVLEFKERVQNDRVSRFSELDILQLQIAQIRIREKLISKFPKKDGFISGDELSILLHELDKKKRHMTLRNLFRSIPNLLLKLKPCLMMSPLSVSYFLEAETYEFDMVIFDEASQIFTQDAVGAICRANQVIIVGDSKQLPPSNFFSATSNHVIYDDINADYNSINDENISKSILDEAKSLPKQQLLWHYRSRHESLISFSNKEFYKDKLITFPSTQMNVNDMGVEYIYTQDGVYEERKNIKEAEQCIRLILNHIQNYPERSLGIIAFSQKQQSIIEEHVEFFRLHNQEYEWFFNEDNNEPFFIKNLENVQGDERDTIFFSICYAKNSQGHMSMRFGPLGHSGGERRLNVAVTRAKCNIKLIGSILPTDIDLNRTNSDGVRLLRSYIELAMKSNTFFQNLKIKDNLNEDLFCEKVVKFLENSGYNVVKNIGYSNYKIDIGIEKKDLPGCFVAGIECDGNMYVMAKTARDRDRLRTSILTNMGWNLYRIWSTDWIRNPKEAQIKLLKFVEEAMQKPVVVQKNILLNDEIVKNIITNISELIADKSIEKSNSDFFIPIIELDDYKIANLNDDCYMPNSNKDDKIMALILHIINIEQPVHVDLVYQRLAGVFGNQKVTSIVRKNIDSYLIYMKKNGEIKFDDNFLLLSSIDKIPMRKFGGRSIEYISMLEIAEVMIAVVKNYFGLSEKVLIAETTKLFGFERKGPKISTIMNLTVDYLKAKNKIRIVDDKIQILEE